MLITRGRKSGREHRVRLWFAREGDLLWLRTDASKRRPDWYRNLIEDRHCRVVVDGAQRDAVYEPSADVDADLRHVVEAWRAKYGAIWVQDWYVERGRLPVKLRLR